MQAIRKNLSAAGASGPSSPSHHAYEEVFVDGPVILHRGRLWRRCQQIVQRDLFVNHGRKLTDWSLLRSPFHRIFDGCRWHPLHQFLRAAHAAFPEFLGTRGVREWSVTMWTSTREPSRTLAAMERNISNHMGL